MIDLKISIQTGHIINRLGYEKGYAMLRTAGFEAIDWNLHLAAMPADLISGACRGSCIFEKALDEILEYYSEELDAIRRNNLEITQAHAPFPAYHPSDPTLTEYVSMITCRMIEFCDKVGCRNLVVHGISDIDGKETETVEDLKALNIRFYASLIPTLLEHNVTVCLENLFTGKNCGMDILEGCCSDQEDAAELIDTLNEMAGREVFGLCLDSGHLNVLHRDPRRYIPQLGSRIKATHLHDNNGVNDEHIVPFAGTINWTHLCQSLRLAGYSGDLSFETFLQTDHVMDFSEELLMPWLTLIHACGEAFASAIGC